MAGKDRRLLSVGKIISNPIQHGSSGGGSIKACSSRIGWPRFPDIPAFNEGRVGMGIKTATEDLSNEASTGWKPVEASLVSLTGICYQCYLLKTGKNIVKRLL
jgi:hypothetical protein